MIPVCSTLYKISPEVAIVRKHAAYEVLFQKKVRSHISGEAARLSFRLFRRFSDCRTRDKLRDS